MRCFAIALTCTVLFAAIAKNAAGSTVAYYRFEEGSPNAVASGTGGVLDSSGNALNGTALNGPTYSPNVPVSTIPQTGASNNLSMHFAGTGQTRVFIPDSSQFSITHSLTIEAYFNVAAIPNTAGSILFRGDDRSGFDPYFLNVEPGQIRFGITDASNNSALVTAPLPGYNQWIFAAGVLDTTNHTMSLYVNGALANTISTNLIPLGALDPSEEPGVAIGGHPSTFYGDFMTFDGLIDEVRLSDTALSPSQFLDVPEPLSLGGMACLSLMCVRRRAA
jgi:hypothetical protein